MTSPRPLVDPALFRAYDIRGRTDRGFTLEAAERIGQAIGSYAYQQQAQAVTDNLNQHSDNTVDANQADRPIRLCIGRDGRPSSPDICKALCKGLNAAGVDVIDLGEIPTGTLYFGIKHLQLDSGLMITGSHNPPQYNGIKIILGGKPLADNDIQALRRIIEQRSYYLPESLGQSDQDDIQQAYLDAIDVRLRPHHSLNVVVDAGNGVAGPLAIRVLEQLGHRVTPLYCDIDGDFPNHHPDPSILENLQDLQAKVISTQANLGIALDGDGDRVWAIDEQGQVIWPDRLFLRILRDWLPEHPGATILYDVKCTHLLEAEIQRLGGKAQMCRTGHSVIKQQMTATNSVLAAEMSGHYFFGAPWILADDGLYGAGWILQWLSQQSLSLSALMDELPKTLSTAEIKVPVPETLSPHQIVNDFQLPATAKLTKIITLDGLRMESSSGWALVRASNTTPDLTLRFEANTAPALAELIGWVKAGLEQTEIENSLIERLLDQAATAKQPLDLF
jgi:phosphomannomutase/phosphoglucomutase